MLAATEETIDREFAKAKSKLTAKIASAYVIARKQASQAIRTAKLEARTERVDDLRDAHQAAIEERTPREWPRAP